MIEKQWPELVSCKSLAVVLPPEKSNCCHLSKTKTCFKNSNLKFTG